MVSYFILSVNKYVLYLNNNKNWFSLVTPIRTSRPTLTTTTTEITSNAIFIKDPFLELAIDDQSKVLIEPKTAALVSNEQRQSIL